MNSNLKEELQKPIVKYGIAGAAVLLALQHVIVPWFEWRNDTVDELHVKSGMLVSPNELEGAIEELTVKNDELKSELAALKKRFPKDDNSNVKLPTEIRALFKQFDVAVNRVSITELETQLDRLNLYGISIEANGSADRLFSLVSKLENDASFFIVDRVTLYGRKGQKMKVRMELQKYVQR